MQHALDGVNRSVKQVHDKAPKEFSEWKALSINDFATYQSLRDSVIE